MANAFTPPTFEDLKNHSDKRGLACTDDDLNVYKDILAGSIESYSLLWGMPEPGLPVKYPRTPGYKPDATENKLNAWAWKCEIKGGSEGKLKGKTIAAKDNVFVAGVPLMNGSRTLEGFIPEYDATIITELLDEGGTILGKSTCEDLCLSGASYWTTFGPVRNPWNPDHSAGGSSSGSGALVAAGEVDLAIGGDQGGSIRIPASCCGIIGHKPTWGLVPYTGVIPIETTVDHTGPMARTVRDCALMLEVMAVYDNGADGRQPSYGYPKDKMNFIAQLDQPTSDLKIGVLKEGFECCEADVKETVGKAVEALKSSGKFSVVEEVSIPMHTDGHHIWGPIGFIGGVNQMVDGAGYGTGLYGLQSSRLSEKLRQGIKDNSHALSHTAKMVTLFGSYTMEKYGFSLYSKAQSLGLQLRKKYDEALTKYDVIVMPTLPQTPCKLPTKETSTTEAIGNALAVLNNTCPFNFTHHPALTLNAGFSAENNLPVGLMIVGRHWDDGLVLRVGNTAEAVLKQFQRIEMKYEK